MRHSLPVQNTVEGQKFAEAIVAATGPHDRGTITPKRILESLVARHSESKQYHELADAVRNLASATTGHILLPHEAIIQWLELAQELIALGLATKGKACPPNQPTASTVAPEVDILHGVNHSPVDVEWDAADQMPDDQIAPGLMFHNKGSDSTGVVVAVVHGCVIASLSGRTNDTGPVNRSDMLVPVLNGSPANVVRGAKGGAK